MSHCLWCGYRGTWIEVHGHYQCPDCGKNVDECCQGECDINTTPVEQLIDNQ